jgi:hypothetical protein
LWDDVARNRYFAIGLFSCAQAAALAALPLLHLIAPTMSLGQGADPLLPANYPTTGFNSNQMMQGAVPNGGASGLGQAGAYYNQPISPPAVYSTPSARPDSWPSAQPPALIELQRRQAAAAGNSSLFAPPPLADPNAGTPGVSISRAAVTAQPYSTPAYATQSLPAQALAAQPFVGQPTTGTPPQGSAAFVPPAYPSTPPTYPSTPTMGYGPPTNYAQGTSAPPAAYGPQAVVAPVQQGVPPLNSVPPAAGWQMPNAAPPATPQWAAPPPVQAPPIQSPPIQSPPAASATPASSPVAGMPNAPIQPVAAPSAAAGQAPNAGAPVAAAPPPAKPQLGSRPGDPPPPGTTDVEGAKVIARVGTEVIMAADVLPMVNEMLMENADKIPPDHLEEVRTHLMKQRLNKIIQTKIVLGEIHRKVPDDGYKKFESKVNDEFNNEELPKMIKRAKCKNEAEFEAMLRKTGSSIARERKGFTDNYLAMGWVRQEIDPDEEISHEQMLEYYYAHIKEYDQPARVRWEKLVARFDKYPSKADAYRAIGEAGNQVINGANFESVAEALAEGRPATAESLLRLDFNKSLPTPGSTLPPKVAKANGKNGKEKEKFNDNGLEADDKRLEWTTKGSLVSKVVDNALFTMPVGCLSPILADDRGFQIVRVIERKEAGRVPFLEAQVEIRKKIRTDRSATAIQDYVDRITEKAQVWNSFDDPEASPNGFTQEGYSLKSIPQPTASGPAGPNSVSGPSGAPVMGPTMPAGPTAAAGPMGPAGPAAPQNARANSVPQQAGYR